MGRKVGLDLGQITAVAVDIVETDGLEAATLTSVATRLGVKVPSLYNHVSGVAGLRRLITLAAVEELTHACRRAVESVPGSGTHRRGDELRAVARAYRRFAVDHPGLYRSMLPAPTPQEDPELQEAMTAPVRVAAEAMAAVSASDEAITTDTIHEIRALRSLVHGFVDLEINGGFGMPVDIEDSFDRAIELFVSCLAS